MPDLTREELAARGLRVKALEWHDAGFEKCASSVAGYHRVFERNGFWRAVIHTRADAYFVAECETEEAAKAAAQADYAARILAALEDTGEPALIREAALRKDEEPK